MILEKRMIPVSTSRHSYRVSFPGSLGESLAGIIDRPEPLTEDAPVLVLSHCFTCNKDLKALVRISRGLAERGIAVLRFDMTGLGGSDGDFSRTTFATNVADLKAAIGFAQGELGRVTSLMGHSFGGAASMAVAASHGGAADHLKAIITLAAPSDTVHLAKLLATMNPRIESEGVGEVSIGGRPWTIGREMTADFRSHDLPAFIAKIKIPALVFQSPDDTTVGYDHAIRIVGLMQNQASLFTLAGADHLLSDPRDIEVVTATAAAFLRRYA